MATPDGVGKGLAIILDPTDCVVAPFGKSGTTWLQQIAHSLRTRGDMDFDDISRVVPWIEMSTDLGLDLDLEITWPSTERRGGLASGIDGLGTLDLPQCDVARVRIATSLRAGGDWELLELVDVGDAVGRLVVLGRLGR